MCRIPSLAISSWSGDFGVADFNLEHILRDFSTQVSEYACVFADATRSDKDDESREDWGTDEEWEQLEKEAMSTEEFNRISAYLDETGHTSA